MAPVLEKARSQKYVLTLVLWLEQMDHTGCWWKGSSVIEKEFCGDSLPHFVINLKLRLRVELSDYEGGRKEYGKQQWTSVTGSLVLSTILPRLLQSFQYGTPVPMSRRLTVSIFFTAHISSLLASAQFIRHQQYKVGDFFHTLMGSCPGKRGSDMKISQR